MKIFFITGLSFLMSLVSWLNPTPPIEETKIPVCYQSSDGMASLAAKPAFQRLHLAPKPFTYKGAGEMVKFTTPDGQQANGFLLKAKKPSKKWLFVYQEWWGLNDNIKQEAERIYNSLQDVNVIAPDLYDGKVTTDPAEAGKLVATVPQDRLTSIAKGAIAYAGPDAEFASIGWCYGGGMSLQSAILEGKRAKGCVLYYGFPEQNVERLKMLETDVLAIFGSKDTMISSKLVNQFEENMQKAGKKVTVKRYDAGHAFANPSNLINTYNKQAAEDANKSALTYLKERLKA
jgi:carboxymethylenebutenolidase